ncbi:MAG TPA: 4-hydroxythreonine-4-phosphate dehydrogenase PdxA [Desulfurivibrionaceae bacterium]|nr:4-hydroxythreonine-4-phosphate dehydrogenase PdxA [Desulfurivibrionaceae bacterium]
MAAEILGITMGCPVGIGPEIVLRFHLGQGRETGFAPVVLGDPGVLARCRDELGLALEIVNWQPGELVKPGAVNVLPLSDLGLDLQWGRPDAATGKAMGGYIETAVRLLRAGALAGMVTCPITKTALNLGGYPYPGHTEMLAALCGGGDFAMMLAGGRLRVTLVTIHVGLGQVPRLLSAEKVARLIVITGQALRRDFGIAQPRLAVAALNPHAGESGMFGDEERRLIEPGMALAAAEGWLAEGPFPPDTVFHQAAKGRFDAVVCMYHDQGLIPFKLLHFEDGVNVTLGLPIVRTSVDHGTAYDIAGLGMASPASLLSAFRLAGEIVVNRQRIAELA